MEHFLYSGLGNVGPKFSGTRHNLGIETLRAWVESMKSRPAYEVSEWVEKSEYSEARIENQESSIHCLFPTTMMNESGRAVMACLNTTKIPLGNLLVIHDDVELPLGEVKLTLGGSAKGHNGVRSIQNVLGTSDFKRLRLGVGRPPEGMALNEFVLNTFQLKELEVVESMISKATKVLSEILSEKPSTRL